jgi:hypothetical protein
VLCTAKFDDIVDRSTCNHGYAVSAFRCLALQIPLKSVQNFLGLELWEVFERRDEVRNDDVAL